MPPSRWQLCVHYTASTPVVGKKDGYGEPYQVKLPEHDFGPLVYIVIPVAGGHPAVCSLD